MNAAMAIGWDKQLVITFFSAHQWKVKALQQNAITLTMTTVTKCRFLRILLWEFDGDRFDLRVLLQAILPALSTVPRLFEATKWCLGCDHIVAVDPN